MSAVEQYEADLARTSAVRDEMRMLVDRARKLSDEFADGRLGRIAVRVNACTIPDSNPQSSEGRVTENDQGLGNVQCHPALGRLLGGARRGFQILLQFLERQYVAVHLSADRLLRVGEFHGSPSVDARGPESRSAFDSIVGGASGALTSPSGRASDATSEAVR